MGILAKSEKEDASPFFADPCIRSIEEPMICSRPVTEIIQTRFSCRSYLAEPVFAAQQRRLQDTLSSRTVGPLGTPVRFDLIAAGDQDPKALRGLGTYGFIKGATAFILGTACPGPKNLEDYGYRLEQIVLYTTDLGLGTCWLGGTFTRSTFARKLNATREEKLPAVVAMGLIADEAQARQTVLRRRIGADQRLPWNALFFDRQFNTPLSREKAGPYATPLEMVRLGPSASNKQPWRILQDGHTFHFYIQRTKGYRNALTILAGIEDMQRLDLGIAMCHFELTARELGIKGQWTVQEPSIAKPDDLTEYAVSWVRVE